MKYIYSPVSALHHFHESRLAHDRGVMHSRLPQSKSSSLFNLLHEISRFASVVLPHHLWSRNLSHCSNAFSVVIAWWAESDIRKPWIRLKVLRDNAKGSQVKTRLRRPVLTIRTSMLRHHLNPYLFVLGALIQERSYQPLGRTS